MFLYSQEILFVWLYFYSLNSSFCQSEEKIFLVRRTFVDSDGVINVKTDVNQLNVALRWKSGYGIN